MPVLESRARCYYSGGVRYCERTNAWNSWVRWLFLGLIIGGFLLLFVLCSCVSARRRRRAGQMPFRGTGWAVPNQGQYQHQHPPPQNNAVYYSQPAPPYSPPPQGGYYGNQGQQQGYEMNNQSSQPAYPTQSYAQDGGNMYQPPPGPPPGKDGVVR
ncbi:hypothetical protein P152DRAFT_470335 [Eremomyces bilateralis CBS 781.70]|uniref:Chitin synthesis regulation, Congo red resistance, RCR protein n=1 Tax=Eremomyces bilateralis CBS 781.70 TaxID=1392243 RepID=A0A6G1GEK0_9PEZI|nr:uncharacterized protein P152DRAFT_470335 [Eremomyces bilateralis CBS 781.70]KAF1816299.1 hypothetical protein P152DRAFT_470335 [Eremomyces bilateralis CBS 781.70]